ncbi:TetR/AcrR family transcriptional regulator [Pseudomonas sp. App30]|uniref:TetR/AcrR family transcriptional regulator n=1 Tax=Pseudomonas sp. App30 TaxID=3068990 RepID=UPI003A8038B5
MRTKTEKKRQEIIDAAFQVFSEIGFAQAAMGEIALRAGASKATLYSYFESKEELFTEVMCENAVDEVKAAFLLLDPQVAVEKMLLDFGIHYLTAVLAPQMLAVRRLANHEGGRSDLGVMFHERGPKRGWQMVMDLLEQYIQQGHLRSCDARVATAHLRGLYEAELMELSILGVIKVSTRQLVRDVVKRALAVFLLAYGPGAGTR